ncbi:MAG: iron ABC transporter permease [Armatimonadetes bacterium]|nr:iron ABC transporter permease [Armatimonadota bacterium]
MAIDRASTREWAGAGAAARAREASPLSREWTGAAAVVALLMAAPLAYLAFRAITGGPETWRLLWSTRLPGLLVNTLGLTAVVTAASILLGVPLAWLVERTDLPGRRLWRWILALPLVIPPYVGAVIYTSVFGPRGFLEVTLESWLGREPFTFHLPSIYSLWGTALVLVLFTYPYVYLLALAVLRTLNRSLEEAARACGHRPWSVFFRVTLPLMRPGIAAGALLVALYALSDFGAVSLLRYQTFTYSIYLQLTGRYDRTAAAALSLVLAAITLSVLWMEARARGRAQYYQTASTWRPFRPVPLGGWRIAGIAAVALVAAASLLLPLGSLVVWTAQGLVDRSAVAAVWAGTAEGLWRPALHSVAASAVAATESVVLALPLAYLAARDRTPRGRVLTWLAQAGYALPGVVVALSMVFLVNRFLPWLYGTAAIVVLAYVVRFLPQALQAEEAALAQVSPNLEEAARSLGRRAWQTLLAVVAPLISGGLLTAWAMVFLTALKELPATLLLRPAGFDTLPVRIWMPGAEGLYAQAAPAALVLIVCSTLPMALLLTRGGRLGLPGVS